MVPYGCLYAFKYVILMGLWKKECTEEKGDTLRRLSGFWPVDEDKED